MRQLSVNRRDFIVGSASALAAGLMPVLARANVPVPYDWNAAPPLDSRVSYIDWMVKTRGKPPRADAGATDSFRVTNGPPPRPSTSNEIGRALPVPETRPRRQPPLWVPLMTPLSSLVNGTKGTIAPP